MIRLLRALWHDFRDWRHLVRADRHFGAAKWHLARSAMHKAAKARLRSPATGPPDPRDPAEGQHAPAQDGP